MKSFEKHTCALARIPLCIAWCLFLSQSHVGISSAAEGEIFLAQGLMSGEVSDSTVLLQTRLTATEELNAEGDIPGVSGVVAFEYSQREDFSESERTAFTKAAPESDFIVRHALHDLQPGTRYYYRAHYGADDSQTRPSATCSFKTLPGKDSETPVHFVMGSCMNYNKFMHGAAGKASGPVTATPEDKRLGYPAFPTMQTLSPEFFIGTGDIVYYDNPKNNAQTIAELRQCWHEQFRFPRLVSFFADTPGYWSKDDHDFRFNDSDSLSERLPLPQTGIEIFREQLPILPSQDQQSPTYRTHRVNKYLQLWFTEGRDFRSPNKQPDGPEKTLWGTAQREWLQRTLKESDATWKILISPTPMVGPDDGYKTDNHVNLGGFRHEADAFFDWLAENDIQNFFTFCGDRHWQFHSIHPSGVEEFACGALNDENSRLGVAPGDAKGTDPDRLVRQPFLYPEPSGGFLHVTAGPELSIEFRNDQGEVLYSVSKR